MKRKSAFVQIAEGFLLTLGIWELGIIFAREWVMAETVSVNILPPFIAEVLLKAYPVLFIVFFYLAGKSSGKKRTNFYLVTTIVCLLLPAVAYGIGTFCYDAVAETPAVLPVMLFGSVVKSIVSSDWIKGTMGHNILGIGVPAVAALCALFAYNQQTEE